MNIVIKKMETDTEINGKAYVHWKSYHEAYTGIISRAYLDSLTLESCEKQAFSYTENLIVAKDGERVIGFAGYGDSGGETPKTGELFALYVLADYYGTGVGFKLMEAALEQLKDYPKICLWVLKENGRARRFYQKCGFCPDGEEIISEKHGADVIRMVLNRQR